MTKEEKILNEAKFKVGDRINEKYVVYKVLVSSIIAYGCGLVPVLAYQLIDENGKLKDDEENVSDRFGFPLDHLSPNTVNDMYERYNFSKEYFKS